MAGLAVLDRARLRMCARLVDAPFVDPDTSWLLRRLESSGGSAEAARERSPHRWREDIARLIADGVLEVDADGTFRRGPEAVLRFWPTPRDGVAPTPLAALTMRALRHVARFPALPVRDLAAALYTYHSSPVSPRWRSRAPSAAATLRYLGLDDGGKGSIRLRRSWRASENSGECVWLGWNALDGIGGRTPAFKLYVSPRADALPDVVHLVIDVLTELRVPAFKIGADAGGLLRPDRFVAYFHDRRSLDDALTILASALAGAPAHGVPFTCAATRDGLLSWGVDPSRYVASGPDDRAGRSWRGWVTAALAHFLHAARARGLAPEECALFAASRLALDGVDVVRWAPDLARWDPTVL